MAFQFTWQNALIAVAILFLILRMFGGGGGGGVQAAASHILVPPTARELAVKLKSELEATPEAEVPAKFAALAREHSTCPSKSKGGALGTFGRGQMVPEFDAVVFSAEVGKVQGPVQTQFGHHLILVTSRADPAAKAKGA